MTQLSIIFPHFCYWVAFESLWIYDSDTLPSLRPENNGMEGLIQRRAAQLEEPNGTIA